MKIKSFLFITVLFLSSGLMAQTISVTFEGSKQGRFKGESMRKGMEGKSEVISYLSEVISPRDAASGQPTGRRSYQPVMIQKLAGAASPQLLQALTTNEVIRRVVIEFYRRDQNGMDMNYYTITLENVNLSGFKQFVGPLDNARSNGQDRNLYDEIRMVFQKITVEEKTGGTVAQDDWNVRF